MWTLTICSLLLVTGVVVAVVVCVAAFARVTVRSTRVLAEVMSETVEKLIQPVVDPSPIRQVDIPEQTEMLSEPAWANDWNPPS